MKVLALCLALVVAASADDNVYCYPGIFGPANFASQDNLRCRPQPPISVVSSTACVNYTESNTQMPYGTNFFTICEDGYTLIGYDEFDCDLTTGVYAAELADSSYLEIHSSCVDSTDLSAVCEDTNAVNDDQQLLSVSNAAVQSENDADIVYYSVSCNSGYSFKDGADASSVYGYCNDPITNAYTFHADSDSDGCFAVCPANPAVALLAAPIDNLESLVLVESANGAANSAEAVCSSGFDIVDGAADFYDFTCDGALADSANEGKVSCIDCPVCIATCPADAGASLIVDAAANLASLSNSQAKSGEVFSAIPVCDDGFAIADDAAESYDYLCGSTVNDVADSGLVTCDDSSCPSCLAKCLANTKPNVDIDGLASLSIDEGVAYEEVVGIAVCDSDSAIAWEDSDEVYKFTCSPSADDAANDGKFTCGVDHECPSCEAKCPIEENDELSFLYIDESVPSGLYLPGANHIEASCKNASLTLIGERYASCSNGSLNWDDEAPICADGDACEHPVVNNAYLPVTDNVLAGEKYTIICDAGFSFDSLDAEVYGSYSEAVVTCRGSELPEMSCYAGCGKPEVLGGSVVTSGNEAGKAPYEDGDVVNFSCDGSILSGSEVATCEMGLLASPVCGACSLATTSLLLISALFYLLF